MKKFPKNAWYVAARSDEVLDKPLGRSICSERIVFYRADGGKIAALEDFCPHRGAPLSLGKCVKGKLVCGYHGLEMGCDGKTTAMPMQRVRGFPAIKTYPVSERFGFIWVWTGEAALAKAEEIPTPVWANNTEWAYGGGLYHINCDYRLMVDNLMDLTHETYVHATSIGQKEIDESPVNTKVEGDEVITSRYMEGVPPPPFWAMALQMNELPTDQLVDRWQICHFTPPSHVMIEVGVALAGKGGHGAPLEHKVSSIVVDYITPETDSSMWYFWGMARNFKAADPKLTDTIREGQGKIFSEDMEMLESQQKNITAHPERSLLMLNIDSGGVQSRRIIDRMIIAEAAASSSTASK